MPTPFATGGCLCGAVRYSLANAPVGTGQCHCKDCQRASGTGHPRNEAMWSTSISMTEHASAPITQRLRVGAAATAPKAACTAMWNTSAQVGIGGGLGADSSPQDSRDTRNDDALKTTRKRTAKLNKGKGSGL